MLRSLSRIRTRPASLPRGWRAAVQKIPPSVVVILAVRLGLTLTSLKDVRASMLPRIGNDRHIDLVAVARLAWAVKMAAYLVPFASCLTQAQACQILLARQGWDSTLFLGVRRTPAGKVEAHAWLRCGDNVVVGGDAGALAPFQTIAQLPSIA